MGIVASDMATEVESLGLFHLSCSLERHMTLLLQSKIVIRFGVPNETLDQDRSKFVFFFLFSMHA